MASASPDDPRPVRRPTASDVVRRARRGYLVLMLGASTGRRNLLFRSDLGLPGIRALGLHRDHEHGKDARSIPHPSFPVPAAVVGLGQQPGRESTAGGQVVGGVLPQGFVDVDGLKRVNDARGHAAGDRLLTCVAYALVSALRTADIVTRYGGDKSSASFPAQTTPP